MIRPAETKVGIQLSVGVLHFGLKNNDARNIVMQSPASAMPGRHIAGSGENSMQIAPTELASRMR